MLLNRDMFINIAHQVNSYGMTCKATAEIGLGGAMEGGMRSPHLQLAVWGGSYLCKLG